MSEKEDQYWDKIDDYLDGNLGAEAHRAFRQQLAEDQELAKDTLFQQEMRQGIAYGSQEGLRSRLQTIHEETVGIGTDGKIVPIGRQLWLRWATAAALLIGALGILFWLQEKPTNQQLFADHYVPYQVDDISRSPGEEEPATLALQAYRAQRYPAAIDQLSRILQNDPENPSLQLVLAISYWETGQTAAAKSAVRTLFTHPLLKDQAYWYAALFALAENQPATAKEYLEQIPADSGTRYEQAVNLLKALP